MAANIMVYKIAVKMIVTVLYSHEVFENIMVVFIKFKKIGK